MKNKLISTILIFMMSFTLFGCGNANGNQAQIAEIQASALEEAQRVETVRGSIQRAYVYDAQIGPRITQLKFAQEGIFKGYNVKLGQTVKTGDTLATLDMEGLSENIENKEKEIEALKVDYEYNVASIDNNIALAEIDLEQCYKDIEALKKDGLLGDSFTALCVQAGLLDQNIEVNKLRKSQAAESYELNANYLKAQLAKMKKKLVGDSLKAPCDGVIVALNDASYGDWVDTNKYFAAVAENDVFYARCEMSGTSIVKNSLEIYLWVDGEKYEITYVPRSAEYTKEMRNSTEKSYGEFLIEAPKELSMGQVGKIYFITGQKENTLLVPKNCIVTNLGESFVYMDVDGVPTKTSVKVGIEDGINAEILEGLSEGDVVYVQE